VAPFHLVASSDDFLLEEQLRETTRAASESFGGVEPEVLPPEITPEDLATALCSPSLFTPQRVLVVPEASGWFAAPLKRGAKKASRAEQVDTAPIEHVLDEGLSEDVALIVGACCPGKPRGALVTAADTTGTFRWLAAPEAPKPWENVEFSREQEEVLRGILARVAGDVRFTAGATRLLFHRLGYAPRLLSQEVRKLAAAKVGDAVDEDLVRALCFPKERSLEAVRDAVFAKRPAPILDLLVASENGLQVRDWRGQPVPKENLAFMIASQVGGLFQQMLYLRRLAVRIGMEGELAPERVGRNKWYPYHFKNGFGPALVKALESDAPSPIVSVSLPSPVLISSAIRPSPIEIASSPSLLSML